MGKQITITLEAPEGYEPVFFLSMLQAGAAEVVERAGLAVFEAMENEQKDWSIAFRRRHYEACKAYQAEVNRVMKEAMRA